MKAKVIFIYLTVLVLGIGSCSDEYEDGCKVIDLGLEKTEIKTTSEGSSFSVKTKESNWGISGLRLLVEGKDSVVRNTFYVKEINGNKINTYLETMSGEWYEVIKSSEKELTVKVFANKTGKERKLIVSIVQEVSDAHLTIIQD